MPDSQVRGKSQICRCGESVTRLALIKEHALRLGMLGQDAGKEGAIGTSNVYDPAMPVPVVVHHRHMQACSGTCISMPCQHAWRTARVEQCSDKLAMLAPNVACHHHMHACKGNCKIRGTTMLMSKLRSRMPLYYAMALKYSHCKASLATET